LGDAVVIAQIDEQKPAVVADAMAPAGQAHLGPDVALAQGAACMGAVAMHVLFRGEKQAQACRAGSIGSITPTQVVWP
jgi:hypothetical protein